MKVVRAECLTAVAIAFLCSASSTAADEATEVGSYKKGKPESFSYTLEVLAHGGFEQGLSKPWGTFIRSDAKRPWRSVGGSRSAADTDTLIRHSGARSLRIFNPDSTSPRGYGETAQVMVIEPDRPYRVSLWARADDLVSKGGVSVLVGVSGSDEAPFQSVIELPSGSYAWKRFVGEFTFPATAAEFVIRSRDKGQVWLDDIDVRPADEDDADDTFLPSSSAGAAADPPETVMDVIRQYRLDPDFVHCGGPLYVKLPEGRIFIRETLLRFGPKPFPMAVELTTQPLPSNPHAFDWTVTGPGWDRVHRGWTTEAGDPLKIRLTSPEGHWIIRHAKPNGVFDKVSTSAGFGWKLELDERGGIAAVEDTNGRRVEYANWPNGNLKSVTGPDKEQWTFGYNDLNQLVQITGRHNGYSAKIEYYPNGKVEAVEGPQRLEFDYKDHQNHLTVDLFGRTRSANVYRFAKDGRATTVGVFGGPHVTCRYDSSGTLVEVQDSYGRCTPDDASEASLKGLHEAFTDAVIEIRECGLLEFLDRRFERAGNRLSESVSETVRTVTDAATGNANQALDASAEESGDFQRRRQRAFVRIQRWIREAVHPAVLPIYEAVEIASNPDDQQRLQGLANWIESEANSVLETLATQAQNATRDDVILRVRERIREPVYDRMQNLPPRLQQMIRGSLEWAVGQAFDGGVALGGRAISGGNTEAGGQTPSGGRTSPGGQTPPETRPPEITNPPRAVAVTTEDIKRALRKALQRMGVQPRYLYGPEVFRSPSFLIVGPEEVFLHDKATTEYKISLRRLANSDQARRCLDEWTVKPSDDGSPPHLKYVIRERSREVKAVIKVSRLDRPATKHLPESWSHGSCSYAWLLDDRTFVVFSLYLWPARGPRPVPAPIALRQESRAPRATSRPVTRPPWSNWTKEDYLSRTRPILVTIMRVLEDELGIDARET